MNLIAHVWDQSKSMLCHSARGRRADKWQKLMSQEIVLLQMWYLSPIPFLYPIFLLCLSLQLNFSFAILCVAPIKLQWNNKNSLKRPSQTWLWKGYMTSSKETVSVKRIQVVDCIQSCLSRHELLLIWRKNTQNRVDLKTKNILIFGDEFSKYLPSLIFSYSNLIHSVLQGWFPLGIGQ